MTTESKEQGIVNSNSPVFRGIKNLQEYTGEVPELPKLERGKVYKCYWENGKIKYKLL